MMFIDNYSIRLTLVPKSLLPPKSVEYCLHQGSAVGRDQNGIPVPGLKIPGFDRDRDSLFQIFRDPGRDRDYLPRSGIPVKSR